MIRETIFNECLSGQSVYQAKVESFFQKNRLHVKQGYIKGYFIGLLD